MDLGLKDKVVFITGASGGIGQALADAFAAEGSRLALHGHRNFAALRDSAAGRWDADRVLVFGFDLREPDPVVQAMESVAARFGRIDVCVANAGAWPRDSLRLDELSAERVQQTLGINLLGAVWTARAFMRALARSGPRADGQGASLLFIGSTAGRYGERGHCDYAISKAGLYGLVRTLKNEIVSLDPRARVNMIEPGWTRTAMAERTLHEPETVRRIVRTMPLRQIALPSDIARAALFLSSPAAAAHVSGETLTVAGGMEGRVQWELPEIDVDAIRRRLDQP